MDTITTGKFETVDGHTAEIQYRLHDEWCGFLHDFPRPGQRSALQKWNRDGTHPEVPGWSLKLNPNNGTTQTENGI